jgi:hypothetical protein
MESALMVLHTMLAFGGGLAAGVVLGARVPIVTPRRADSMEVRMASCVLASLLANVDSNAGTAKAAAVPGALVADTGSRAAA